MVNVDQLLDQRRDVVLFILDRDLALFLVPPEVSVEIVLGITRILTELALVRLEPSVGVEMFHQRVLIDKALGTPWAFVLQIFVGRVVVEVVQPESLFGGQLCTAFITAEVEVMSGLVHGP